MRSAAIAQGKGNAASSGQAQGPWPSPSPSPTTPSPLSPSPRPTPAPGGQGCARALAGLEADPATAGQPGRQLALRHRGDAAGRGGEHRREPGHVSRPGLQPQPSRGAQPDLEAPSQTRYPLPATRCSHVRALAWTGSASHNGLRRSSSRSSATPSRSRCDSRLVRVLAMAPLTMAPPTVAPLTMAPPTMALLYTGPCQASDRVRGDSG